MDLGSLQLVPLLTRLGLGDVRHTHILAQTMCTRAAARACPAVLCERSSHFSLDKAAAAVEPIDQQYHQHLKALS